MRYLKNYKLFESEKVDLDWSKLNREQKKGKLLHLYSSIPVQKEKAEKVIKAIVRSSGSHFNIEERGIIKPWYIKDKNNLHDKLRFHDYFNSLLNSKDIRGFNFEGLIAGLFNGRVQPHGSRSDVILNNGKRCSIKFIDSSSESPVLGSIYNSLKNREDIIDEIGDRRIYDVFNTINTEDESLRNEIFDLAFNDVDLFLIAYPDSKKTKIIMHVVTFEQMKDSVTNGLVNAPKNKPGKWQLRISPSAYKSYKEIEIRIPYVSNNELDLLWNKGTRKWSNKVFGPSISKRMRTDVIEDVIDNKEEIVDKLRKDIQDDKIKNDNENP